MNSFLDWREWDYKTGGGQDARATVARASCPVPLIKKPKCQVSRMGHNARCNAAASSSAVSGTGFAFMLLALAAFATKSATCSGPMP